MIEGWKQFLRDVYRLNENLYLISSLIFFTSLVIGISFYMYVNQWSFSLSYYFAASVLLGDMYLIPVEPTPTSQAFTLVYFLWGTTLLAGAVAATANTLVQNAGKVAAEERKRLLQLHSKHQKYQNSERVQQQQLEENGREVSNSHGESKKYYEYFQSSPIHIGDVEDWRYDLYLFLKSIHWFQYRSKYIAIFSLLLWIGVGLLYGLLFEHWTWTYSLKFSLAAVSASGTFPPTCLATPNGSCDLGTTRSLLVGTYIIIGVPIFAYTMGQFAELLVERAIRYNEQRLMMRPLTTDEYKFAHQLRQGKVSSEEEEAEEDEEIGEEELEEENTTVLGGLEEDVGGDEGEEYYDFSGSVIGEDIEADLMDKGSSLDKLSTIEKNDEDTGHPLSLTRSQSISEDYPPPYPLSRTSSRQQQRPLFSRQASRSSDITGFIPRNRSRSRQGQKMKSPKSFQSPHPTRSHRHNHRGRRKHRHRLEIDFGYFVILELLRIQKISKDDLIYMKEVFDRLDDDKDGKLRKEVTAKTQFMRVKPSPLEPIIEEPVSIFSDVKSESKELIEEEKKPSPVSIRVLDRSLSSSLREPRDSIIFQNDHYYQQLQQKRLEELRENDDNEIMEENEIPSLSRINRDDDYGISYSPPPEEDREEEEESPVHILAEGDIPSTKTRRTEKDEDEDEALDKDLLVFDESEKRRRRAETEESEEDGEDECHSFLTSQYNQKVLQMMHKYVSGSNRGAASPVIPVNPDHNSEVENHLYHHNHHDDHEEEEELSPSNAKTPTSFLKKLFSGFNIQKEHHHPPLHTNNEEMSQNGFIEDMESGLSLKPSASRKSESQSDSRKGRSASVFVPPSHHYHNSSSSLLGGGERRKIERRSTVVGNEHLPVYYQKKPDHLRPSSANSLNFESKKSGKSNKGVSSVRNVNETTPLLSSNDMFDKYS